MLNLHFPAHTHMCIFAAGTQHVLHRLYSRATATCAVGGTGVNATFLHTHIPAYGTAFSTFPTHLLDDRTS